MNLLRVIVSCIGFVAFSVGGVAMADPLPQPQECLADSECGPHERCYKQYPDLPCEEGGCEPWANYGVCVPASCADDADCDGGEACDVLITEYEGCESCDDLVEYVCQADSGGGVVIDECESSDDCAVGH